LQRKAPHPFFFAERPRSPLPQGGRGHNNWQRAPCSLGNSRFTGSAGELQVSVEFDESENTYFITGDTNGDARADFMIEVHGQISGLPEA
jgi:hypothetical protein